MSITDELREYTDVLEAMTMAVAVTTRLRGIADSIDAAHKKELAEVWDSIGDESVMAENGWVRLPVDADGEVWHVGDFAVGEVNQKNPKAIERMIWYGPDSGWQLETDTIIYPCPDRPRHHHEPTVEDLLDKFALEIDDARHIPDADEEYARIRAEYAAKLREAVHDA